MRSRDAYQAHLNVLKALAAAEAAATTDDLAVRLGQVIATVRDELFEMVKSDLENSANDYAPLTARLRSSTKELTWLKDRTDEITKNADTAATIVGWATSILSIL